METDYAEKVGKKLGKKHLSAGAAPAPLFQIFTNNGYEITSIFVSSFMGGGNKGPYIDHYILAQEFSPCDHPFLHWRQKPYFLVGACYIKHSFNAPAKRPFAKMLLNHVKAVKNKERPQLTVIHTPDPLHTPSRAYWGGTPDEKTKFSKRYNRRSEMAAKNLADLVKELQSTDPSAIIVAFGDHGPNLSRNADFVLQRDFVVQDRLGVVAGMWPSGTCQRFIPERSPEGYYTTPMIVRLLIKCLSKGDDPFIGPYRHRSMLNKMTLEPQEFAYE